MFIPYTCDAPLYYPPIGTVGLIVLNVLIFAGHATGTLPVDGWLLEFGVGLHPLEWLLSNFAHLDFFHLLGNMVFLWVFGMVVEGKLGLVRFLSCYIAIGAGHGLVQQTLMLGYDGPVEGGMGASAAIFGLMAMACVWAPANEVSVLVWIGWIIHFTFDVSIGMMSAFYFGIETLMAVFVGTVSSSWSHILGALLGAPLAIVLLKRGVVDCEDWDLFSVLSGDYGQYAKEKREAQQLPEEDLLARREKKRLEETRRFEAYLEIGQPLQAMALRRRMADLGCPLEVSCRQLYKLIILLHQQGAWAESAPLMAEYAANFQENADAVRIKLAQICLQALERPHKALETLAAVNRQALTPAQLAQFEKVAAIAQRQVHAGALELDDAPW